MLDRFPREDLARVVNSLQETGKLIYIAAAGASGGLLQVLTMQPGASKFLLEYRFMYHEQATDQFLGKTPEHFVDPLTAEQMAARAYWTGVKYARQAGNCNPDVIGVGMTAAIETNRHRRGDKEVHICVYTPERVDNRHCRFEKLPEDAPLEMRARKREWEGVNCDLFALNALLAFLNLPVLGAVEASLGGFELPPFAEMQAHTYPGELPYNLVAWNGCEPESVLNDSCVGYRPLLVNCPDEVILFPGSFDPLHHGHIGLAEWVKRQTGRTVVYAISTRHPDKMVDEEAIKARLNQFRSFAPVVLHRDAPLFIDKARLHPGVPIVMGADAALKLLNPRYYGDSFTRLCAVLEEFLQLHTVLYVVGRMVKEEGNRYMTLSDLPIPEKYRGLFREVTFREDVASSEIRAARH